MAYTFFNQKFDNGVNEVLSWFATDLMVRFQDITQDMFCFFLQKTHVQLTLT